MRLLLANNKSNVKEKQKTTIKKGILLSCWESGRLENIMKRLCIYLTFDQQNIVDEYIGYMLKELKTCVETLVVVCNALEIRQGRDILEKYADAVFLRENKGFDIGGFKDALCNLIRWEEVLKYDELVLVNDSFFGPFRPMKSIFDEMELKQADFWGLIKQGRRMEAGFYYPDKGSLFRCPASV